MNLDMSSMAIMDIATTAILAAVLIFTWIRDLPGRDAGNALVGSWGLAMASQTVGVAIAFVALVLDNGDLVTVAIATMILAAVVEWQAARAFVDKIVPVGWSLVVPAAFLVAAHSGLLESFSGRLILGCMILGGCNIATAAELSSEGHDGSPNWPGALLLTVTGLGYLAWVPLVLGVQVRAAGDLLTSNWFPMLVLLAVLARIALAFIVLAMAKDRKEREQRIDALTDSLTGLPNRRALFEAADAVAQRRILGGTPVSVLIFDLDRFKETNDCFGHDLGDDVLKIFAATTETNLEINAIVGRLGGEEFAAILPGIDAATAVDAAERVRRAFCRSAAFVNGLAVGASVSVGVACDTDVDADLSALFRRADAALYVAKRAGRNRVAFLEADDDTVHPRPLVALRTSPGRARKPAPVPRRDPIRFA